MMETSWGSRGERGAPGLSCNPVSVTDGDSKGQCQARGRVFGGECDRDAGVGSACLSV